MKFRWQEVVDDESNYLSVALTWLTNHVMSEDKWAKRLDGLMLSSFSTSSSSLSSYSVMMSFNKGHGCHGEGISLD